MQPGQLGNPGLVQDGLRRQGYIASSEISTVLYLAQQAVELVQRLRHIDLRKNPGISETLDWARALPLFEKRFPQYFRAGAPPGSTPSRPTCGALTTATC